MAVRAANEEANIRVSAAFVGSVSLDAPAALARKVADGGNAVGKLPTNGAGRTIHHRHEWFEAPAHIALCVGRYDSQVSGLVEVHAAGEVPLRRGAQASSEAKGRRTERRVRGGRVSWRHPGQRSRCQREG